MLTCPSCGKENQSYYKFCLSCGSDLSSSTPSSSSEEESVEQTHQEETDILSSPEESGGNKRICTTCDLEVPTGFLFCGKCGTRYEESETNIAAPAKPKPSTSSVSSKQGAPQVSLVVVLPDGTEGGRYSLQAGTNIIGRRTDDLFSADIYLSPEHAKILVEKDKISLEDQENLNGCYLKIHEEIELQHSDVFRIGQELVLFEYANESEPLVTPKDDTKVMGSPDPGYWGRILLFTGREHLGNAFPLAEDGIVLGRERADILFPDDGFVSGTHARLSHRGGKAFLADLQSSNGTFIRIREEVSLRPNDHILLGQQLFRVEF